MNNKEIYNMRVVPLVRKSIITTNGKRKSVVVDNLSREEIKNMSCEARMLERKNDDIYFTELPIKYYGYTVKWLIFYLYDELSEEEKERYASRTINIPVTVDTVVKLYVDKARRKEK